MADFDRHIPPLKGSVYQVEKAQEQPECPSVPQLVAGVKMTNDIFSGEKLSTERAFYTAGGELVASCTQEGMIRYRPPR